MRQALDSIAEYLTDGTQDADVFEWHRLRHSHTLKARNWLSQRYKVNTANKMLSALRGVLKAAWRAGLMSADDYFGAVDLRDIKGNSEPPGRMLEESEIASILRVCREDESNAGKRDYALIATMYATGARRAEINGIRVCDYHPDELYIVITKAKNRKDRRVYISPDIAEALNAWLEAYQAKGESPMFCRVLKNDCITGHGVTDMTVYHILQDRAKQAGVGDVTPHDFRRTFISTLIDKGIDLATVAKLAGHELIDDTIVYDRRKNAPAQRAAALITMPG